MKTTYLFSIAIVAVLFGAFFGAKERLREQDQRIVTLEQRVNMMNQVMENMAALQVETSRALVKLFENSRPEAPRQSPQLPSLPKTQIISLPEQALAHGYAYLSPVADGVDEFRWKTKGEIVREMLVQKGDSK